MKDKVTVIGIAGGTGSGKTTVVKKLVEVLPPHYPPQDKISIRGSSETMTSIGRRCRGGNVYSRAILITQTLSDNL